MSAALALPRAAVTARRPHAEARTRTSVLVSIHDATPAFAAEVQTLWQWCRGAGITPALLVVPEWHGAWPLETDPDFVQWLHERVALGADVLLHGERHDEIGARRAWRDAVRAFGRTAGEGEFLTLHYEAARARIERGLVRLSALDLTPIGFVPPAWLARKETHDAVRDVGLLVSEDDSALYHHDGALGRTTRQLVPVLRWSARSHGRAWASRALMSARWRTIVDTPLIRIALHPQDLTHPATREAVRRLLQECRGRRAACRYSDLARWRSR